jgi:hypothetical protein
VQNALHQAHRITPRTVQIYTLRTDCLRHWSLEASRGVEGADRLPDREVHPSTHPGPFWQRRAVQGTMRLGVCLVLLLAAHHVAASGPPKATPRRSDIPFLKCSLCEHLAKHAWRSGQALLKSSTPSNEVGHGLSL